MDASCLDPETISGLLGGSLEPTELARVEAHVSWCDECIDVIAMAARELDTGPRVRSRAADSRASITEPAATGTALAAGTMLGRYEVRRFIGRGGMGDVYEGFDQHLERRVALKVMRDAGDTQTARQRLAREAKTLAQLSHPNVVAAHDVGLQGQHVFLVMELVEGPTLAAWLRAEPRTWLQILDVFLEAGEGLAAAHAVGVVHRDFKPQNVLIGADGKARVSDFGLARSGGPAGGQGEAAPGDAAAGGGASDQLTGASASGGLAGTPRYMAPEQILGLPLDARADQFSFCVALHEALLGVHPTEGVGTPSAAKKPVPRPITSALERGLASDPASRFGSMHELLAKLRRGRRTKRSRVAVAMTVAALALAGGGTAVALREPSEVILTPRGTPADWSQAPVFFKVPDRIVCIDVMSERIVRVIWGTPKRAEDVDVITGARTPSPLVPESYKHGCPQLAPNRRQLIYEGYDAKQRPHIFHSLDATGSGAEAVVSCAPPSHRSEPLWLPSNNEFVFDSDFNHPAVFSLRDNRVWILPDRERAAPTPLGFFKAVSADRILVAEPSLEGRSALHVYRWPGVHLDGRFRLSPEVGTIWTSGMDPNMVFTWGVGGHSDKLLALALSTRDIRIVGRMLGREICGYHQLDQLRAVVPSRRSAYRIRYQAPDGSERDIPEADDLVQDKSPSVATNGDILFTRQKDGIVAIHRYRPSTGLVEQVTPGPNDFGVAALPGDDFLIARIDPETEQTSLVRYRGGSSPSDGPSAWRIPGPLSFPVASPDGKWAIYAAGHQTGASVELVSLADGSAVEFLPNASSCQLIWSSPTTFWVALRFGDGFRWTEIDLTTKQPTRRGKAARSGCFNGEHDPDPPSRTVPWAVIHHDYDLRLTGAYMGEAPRGEARKR